MSPAVEQPKAKDRHKQRKTTAIRRPFLPLLQKLAESHATDITDEVNRAVREMLERAGLWPKSPYDE